MARRENVFMGCEESFITMKLICHSYLVLSLVTVSMKLSLRLVFIVLALTVYLQTIVSETEQGVVASWASVILSFSGCRLGVES